MSFEANRILPAASMKRTSGVRCGSSPGTGSSIGKKLGSTQQAGTRGRRIAPWGPTSKRSATPKSSIPGAVPQVPGWPSPDAPSSPTISGPRAVTGQLMVKKSP